MRCALATLLVTATLAHGSPFADQAPERLSEYIRIDTQNPPGNEAHGVAFLARLLNAAGIDYKTAEAGPGRGNLWARLPGGARPALNS